MTTTERVKVQELCESLDGRPGLPVPNKPTVSVDVKQHFNKRQVGPSELGERALCESRGGHRAS